MYIYTSQQTYSVLRVYHNLRTFSNIEERDPGTHLALTGSSQRLEFKGDD